MPDAFYRDVSMFDKNKNYGKGDLILSFNARMPDQAIIGTSIVASLRLHIDTRTYPEGACTIATAEVHTRIKDGFTELVVERDRLEPLLFRRTPRKDNLGNIWKLVIGNESFQVDYNGEHALNMLLEECSLAFQKVITPSTQTEDVD